MVLAWIVVAAAGAVLAPRLGDRLVDGTTMHAAGYTANRALQREYGGVAGNPAALVVDLPDGTDAEAPRVRAALAAAQRVAAGVRTLSYASTGDRALVGAGGRSTLLLAYPPATRRAVDARVLGAMGAAIVRDVPGARVQATGLALLSAGGSQAKGSVLTELLVGAGLALVVLVWVFGSALAVLPLVSALVSVLAMQVAIYGLTYATDVGINPSVRFIVALLGLGLSIDYSLLLVQRWREERDAGAADRAAVLLAVRRAGHSVAFSALIASLGLFALVVVPVSFVQGVGLAGLFIPSIAVLVALTVVPLLLAAVGPPLDRVGPRRRRAAGAGRGWTAVARAIVAHPKSAAVGGGIVLAVLCGFGLTLSVAAPPAASLASGGTAAHGLDALRRDGFPTGVLTPVPVGLPAGTDPAATAAGLRAVPGVHGVLADPAWRSPAGGSVVMVLPRREIGTAHAGPTLDALRRAAPPGALVGGNQVQMADAVRIVTDRLPVLLAAVAALTFVLLARGMRSLLLPAKAVALNLLSVGAAYGVLVLVWQHGFGSRPLWGVAATGSISTFVPMLLFGFLFGVSMDYEVFILARVREAYDAGGDTRAAVVEGVARTGRLVTSAALILFLALASLSSAPDVTVKMMATGMAAGVLIDAVVVRTLLTPALVVLFGRANWRLPEWARRALLLPSAPRDADARPVPGVAAAGPGS
ncbi:MMPL family transporter [Actinomadura atramentaria]|uniref:MMPL family transporter n=1 Tax=Actinomadura atramentaria TaxID=1990 RepID=UPI000368099B|nr:MMPL family transporter [Actinomadura atramentaria]